MDNPRARARNHHRRFHRMAAALGPLLATLMIGLSTVAGPAAPASATGVDAVIADALELDGRAVELSFDPGLDAAIDRANGAGIAFAWLDRGGDDGTAVSLADAYVEELAVRGGRYQTVLVLIGNGFAASSISRSQLDLDEALDAALPGFAAADMGRGLDAFVAVLAGSTTATSVPAGAEATDSGGGGIGFGTILLIVALLGGGFLLVRRFLTGRRTRAQAEIDLGEDRAEIEEQLKNNADRVIALGDRVIASGDRELIVLYEEASAAYQDVSQRIDDAENAAEIDELDDRIDHAEWQFEVIEATLDGRPRPRPPAPDRGDALDGDPDGDQQSDGRGDRSDQAEAAGNGRRLPTPPGPPSGRGDRPSVATSPRTGRSYPRSSGGRGRTARSGRRGGGLGGVLAGGLGGVLADIVLGGGLGGLGGSSRRTTRRSTSRGGVGNRGRGGGVGGLGGGVLRRGGGSSSRSGSRPSGSSRSSGGRSLGGRSRSRGGRRL